MHADLLRLARQVQFGALVPQAVEQVLGLELEPAKAEPPHMARRQHPRRLGAARACRLAVARVARRVRALVARSAAVVLKADIAVGHVDKARLPQTLR